MEPRNCVFVPGYASRSRLDALFLPPMRAFSLIVVTLFVLLGAVLLVLAVRVYLRTGNTAAAVYAAFSVIGSISGIIAARRNLRAPDRNRQGEGDSRR